MKRLHFHSFRQRLNAAFLAVSLAPLLLCSALLLQIFRFRMTADQQQNAQQQLSSACHALNTMQDGILSAAESLQRDGLVTRALAGAQEDSAKVYSSLYTATAARFYTPRRLRPGKTRSAPTGGSYTKRRRPKTGRSSTARAKTRPIRTRRSCAPRRG